MPPHRRRLNELQDDVWKRNESTLRRLYLQERRTLQDVKYMMESEYGFPVIP
jgi:2-phosphoglycerate kinase